jgi:hypothetical protein
MEGKQALLDHLLLMTSPRAELGEDKCRCHKVNLEGSPASSPIIVAAAMVSLATLLFLSPHPQNFAHWP